MSYNLFLMSNRTSISIVSQWFDRRKGLALSLVLFGIGLGGFCWTLLLRYLDDHLQEWRDRIVAFVLLTIGLLAALLLQDRNGVRKPFGLRSLVPNFSHLKNRAFLWLCLSKMSGFWATWGFYIVFPSIASQVVTSRRIEPWIWAISQGVGNLGRITGGQLGTVSFTLCAVSNLCGDQVMESGIAMHTSHVRSSAQ